MDTVYLRLEPMGRGEGFEFKSEIKGGAIPQEYIPPIEKGIKEKMENGVLAGFPMVDMRVIVYDGSYHEVDSSEIAFKIAGSMAVESAAKTAHLVLLEPIMKVSNDISHKFFRGGNFNFHDRFKKNHVSFLGAAFKAIDPAILKAISEESTS